MALIDTGDPFSSHPVELREDLIPNVPAARELGTVFHDLREIATPARHVGDSAALSSQQLLQLFPLMRILLQHEAAQATEFIGVDLLHRSAPTVRAEGKNVV